MNPKVSIVILNWNGWRDTIECLESLYRISYPDYDVILVDNGSKDDSIEEIKAYLDGKKAVASSFFKYSDDCKPIKILEYTIAEAELGGGREDEIVYLPPNRRIILIRNDKNYGFAEGNNIGIRYALKALDPDYVLLLNNDTVVKDDFLNELIKAINSDESIGFAGPVIYYYNYNGRTDIINVAGINLIMKKGTYHRIGAKEVDQGQYTNIKTVDYLEGSCLLIRRTVLDKIGLLDLSYFAYWEETDLCIRGLDAGYKCVCVPTAKIWHKVSSSSVSTTKLYYMTRNRLWFMKDHATGQELRSFLTYFFINQLPITVGVYLHRKDPKSLSVFLKGVLHGMQPKR